MRFRELMRQRLPGFPLPLGYGLTWSADRSLRFRPRGSAVYWSLDDLVRYQKLMTMLRPRAA